MIWIKCRGSSPTVNVDKEGVGGCRKQTHLSFHLLSLKPRRPSSFSGVLRGTQKGDACVSPMPTRPLMPTGERKHFGVRETPKESVQLSVQAEATEKSRKAWTPKSELKTYAHRSLATRLGLEQQRQWELQHICCDLCPCVCVCVFVFLVCMCVCLCVCVCVCACVKDGEFNIWIYSDLFGLVS